ncbi:hypothetical protein GCM10022225_02970 [Plantactinospora mayteni]|uniref:Uncharacterized protein n=1 Tax=Plantactinospora mayteni TaxID=566021 RepID=A0ABQ4EQ95_9ACTN|nr:hypothetical protein [Plantactinospora mayteni]GIG96785.1 hypothetical protein Pma05_33580 [Plantactinospora mayteni]
MAIKSDVVEFARTLIRGDFEANDRYEEKLDAEGWDGWPRFLSALFFLAVERRFQGGYDEAAVIHFVADLRAETVDDAAPIDASNAESLIRAVFDESVQLTVTPEAMGRIQTLATYKIIAHENLSDEDIDKLLAEAKEIAEE